MSTQLTVVLDDGTVGTIESETLNYQSVSDFIGETITVQLFDENGNMIEVSGKLKEVLQ